MPQQIFNAHLFDLSGTPVTVATLLSAFAILLLFFLVSWMMQRALVGLFRRRGLEDDKATAVTLRLLHYTVVLIGFGVALDTIGFSLSALFAAGAVFAVGVGFAMQNIVQNFVSGFILLLERTIKPGDILEIDGKTVRVIAMGIRTTIVRTRDEEDVILPNSMLAQGTVTNFTFKDSMYRVRASVGVVYHSDLDLVVRTLTEVAATIPGRSTTHEPRIQLTAFGDSSVNFDASIWIEDPWRAPEFLSQLYLAIWWAFAKHGITIAFPQLDVHFDPSVSDGLGRLSATAA